MIHTNIKFMMSELQSRTFLITSSSDGEGKSMVATNLAVSMAQQKKKVLLIDANLRRPALHSFFKTANAEGLTDVLTGRLSFSEAVYHTEVWRLDLLSSGVVPFNPVELIGSQMMQDLLKKAEQNYDVIIIDSNSVLEVTDTKLLANQCDGVILVIQSGKTKLEKAAEAKKVLKYAKAKVVGAVLNQ
ncbi:CpsD/CapB family tyrosine-protein kinase [Bacillus sp. ISL-40]|nr:MULTISPECIES: CpsD/CapB family tyrosine-protein kinase [unclassified Bacillus (in: firmicutes)]MBT2699467.1 CpsD/CapB family tyrosine-protein kinase [Bacillus sp. ISL-40]MBT2721998.1 CpsD/CapB family tyrosine-protein kinase [Bacillus sp. ISL-46]MBT2741654.1 CpsD/CapB family tyrosine-protein kinase [Bacillus sp. ISL-77]